jgi:hypothetical protein
MKIHSVRTELFHEDEERERDGKTDGQTKGRKDRQRGIIEANSRFFAILRTHLKITYEDRNK